MDGDDAGDDDQADDTYEASGPSDSFMAEYAVRSCFAEEGHSPESNVSLALDILGKSENELSPAKRMALACDAMAVSNGTSPYKGIDQFDRAGSLYEAIETKLAETDSVAATSQVEADIARYPTYPEITGKLRSFLPASSVSGQSGAKLV